MSTVKCLAVLCVLSAFGGLVAGAEFVVAPSGNDANPGTKEQQ